MVLAEEDIDIAVPGGSGQLKEWNRKARRS